MRRAASCRAAGATRSAAPQTSWRCCRRPFVARSLAALGTAVTKINHDLRAILATARLVSDGLADSAAPEVRRVAPRLFEAIDRAVALCTRTLDFSREGTPPFSPSRFELLPLIEEIEPAMA